VSLWRFAVGAYAKPQAQAIFLELQDAHRQCVSLLLWRLWTLAERQPVDEPILRAAVSTTKVWDHAAIRPLRDLRRSLEPLSPGFSDPQFSALRRTVQACELTAERLLLEALEPLAAAQDKAKAEEPLRALAALGDAWGATPPKPLLRRLIRATCAVSTP
jgi:uncharacterized protein (TIGR02444 family)